MCHDPPKWSQNSAIKKYSFLTILSCQPSFTLAAFFRNVALQPGCWPCYLENIHIIWYWWWALSRPFPLGVTQLGAVWPFLCVGVSPEGVFMDVAQATSFTLLGWLYQRREIRRPWGHGRVLRGGRVALTGAQEHWAMPGGRGRCRSGGPVRSRSMESEVFRVLEAALSLPPCSSHLPHAEAMEQTLCMRISLELLFPLRIWGRTVSCQTC